tara:strand:- start:107 stop:1135 length:1029 start_codon:yes stop_codon:yes gene_type:complete
MKILITGGCGFVGSNIAFFLKKKLKNAQIYSLDTLIRKGSKSNKNRLEKIKIYNYKIDITDNSKLKKLKKFDLVIDCCAEPAIEASKKDPDRVFNTNLIGTFNILKKCLKDKSHLVFLSSSRVYSINNLKNLFKNKNFKKPIKRKKIINEIFPTSEASSLYGFTKLASEKLIKEFFFKTNLRYIINRFGVIAGPWQFGKQDQGFVPLWLANHFFKKKLNYIGYGGHGNQVRDIIHIDDVCEIILIQIKNLKKINNHTFNIGGGVKNSISLVELTNICKKLTGNNIFFGKKPKTSIFDVPYFISDNRKVLKIYKWKPVKSVDQILKDIYVWLINNKQVWKYFK